MIVPMKKLTLVGLVEDKEKLLHALQAISAVQITSSEEGASESGLLAMLESRVQRLESAAALLKPLAPKGKMGPKAEVSAQELTAGVEAALAICDRVEELDRGISSARSEGDKREGLIQGLLPWIKMEDGIETVKSTASAKVLAGFLPVENIAALKELPVVVEEFEGEKDRALLLACHHDDWGENSVAVRNLGFQEFSFPNMTGTPQENIQRLKGEIAELEKQRQELEERLKETAVLRDDICRALDAATIARDREASKSQLFSTASTFMLQGWVRSDKVEKINKAILKVTDTCYADYSDPEEGDEVPTVLQNSKLVEPYEAVTNLYALPAADGVDGTPLMAPFYFIFFGMMLSDTAYGIVLSLGAYFFLKLLKPDGMMGNLAKVLFMGGISTIFMGVLFGTFAGVTWPVILRGTALENVFPLIDSSSEPIAMLAVCAGMGLVHMFYAVLIATKRCIDKKDYVGAFVDNFCWILIITGLLMLAAPMLGMPAIVADIGKWMAIGAAVVVLLFTGRGKKNPFSRLASGAGKLYDVTSWLGDVLSYARIFALGLSTGVIGLVLNTLCWDMLFASFKGNPVLMIIGFVIVTVLSLALHLFMMAISTLGCFVHTARLQYVEFFGKFYESGGKAFKPLSYKTKHVRINEE